MNPVLTIAVVTETYPPEVNGVAHTIGHLVQGLRRRAGANPAPDDQWCALHH